MNIDSIQINKTAQSSYRQENRKSSGTKAKNTSDNTGMLKSETASSLTTRSQIASFNKKLTEIDFPPFFPIGHFSRADMIKKIKILQEEVERSDAAPDVKKKTRDHKISDNASNAEIRNAVRDLKAAAHRITQNIPSGHSSGKAGKILDLKV